MFAIISDIHSNLEALTTVLDDIQRRGITTIYCLGDILGYAANPKECLDLVIEKTQNCVLGNHDYAVLYEPTNFNQGAEAAAYWTRKVLEDETDSEKANKRWQFLGSQKMRWSMQWKINGAQATLDFVHASPRRPINEYVFPDDVYTTSGKVTTLFERVKHICFIGHTHLPGVFLEDPDFYSPDELGGKYPIVPGEKAIINVGSVGQPRDRDPRAAYAIFDTEAETWEPRRVAYDIEAVQRRIRTAGLPEKHAIRLLEGW